VGDLVERRESLAQRQEFRIVIEGVELPKDVVERISGEVRQAVLAQLASSDFRGDFAARIEMGRTQGIQLVALSSEQARQVGLAE
jgi:uncharacterized protein with gpF-like domain